MRKKRKYYILAFSSFPKSLSITMELVSRVRASFSMDFLWSYQSYESIKKYVIFLNFNNFSFLGKIYILHPNLRAHTVRNNIRFHSRWIKAAYILNLLTKFKMLYSFKSYYHCSFKNMETWRESCFLDRKSFRTASP